MKDRNATIGYYHDARSCICEVLDPAGGYIWITPVGPQKREEIHRIIGGRYQKVKEPFKWKSKREMMSYLHKRYHLYKKGDIPSYNHNRFEVYYLRSRSTIKE